MEELGPSELGTLKYWDNRYQEDIKNYLSHGDPGEVWFGEDIVSRVLEWLNKNVNKTSSIVDIGCGNGLLLVELANEGYTDLTGLDYSQKAVDLAKAITQKHKLKIKFSTFDILEGLSETYEIIHDKGTYDAISLSENSAENRKKYTDSLYKSIGNNGFFIITSCNWTDCELKEQFSGSFEMYEIIPTPQFKFGGKVGNVVSSCVFKRKV